MRKVFVKLIVCYIIAAVAMFALLNLFGPMLLREKLLDKKKEDLYKEAVIIADEYVTNYYNSEINLQDMLNQLKIIDSLLDVRIWVVNSDGAVVADSRGYMTNEVIYLNTLDDTYLNQTFIEDVWYQGIFTEKMLSVIETITFDYTIKGYVSLNVPMSMIEREAVFYLDFVNICFLGFLGVMILAFFFIFFMTVMPIRRIRNAAMQYAAGNFDYEMKIKTHDEYQDLADTIEYMVGELKNMDDYQKKFIANISHDFRSPLTSIKGYAEAMMDGTIPYASQGRYLNIILFETERLTKLTSNLLDMNRIDSTGVLLDITAFDINAVIKKTAATFEGICTEKKIILNLEFSAKETYVEADMGRIQQVLYNLIDNAIKFSNSDSSVRVATEEKGIKVIITVKDYGLGIPKDSVKKIWDRFYKNDTSRGKDKKGTGLGLSIAKEIITAHNENITVVSTEGVGTEFTFTLPRMEEI